MTDRQDYTDYLEDILDACQKALSFVEGLDFEDFQKDNKTVFAVVRALEIIGEASKCIPQSVRDRHPNVPWRVMSGMRDKLIHHYTGVNLKVVWKTVHEDVPSLIQLIQEIVREKKNL
jgi:uncharacterized protein with HEPN domain